MSRKILIVEDDRDMLKLIELNLLDKGYEVLKAVNGEETLNMVKSDNPELVLMDIVLPDLDGFDVCYQIKQDDDKKKVILYTGKCDAIDARRAREANADDFVVKTNDLEYIFNSVEKLLGESK